MKKNLKILTLYYWLGESDNPATSAEDTSATDCDPTSAGEEDGTSSAAVSLFCVWFDGNTSGIVGDVWIGSEVWVSADVAGSAAVAVSGTESVDATD